MTAPAPIDLAWREANPLPVHEAGIDKNGRGRVVLAGGSELVPGALRLTGEAVLRAGAGKLRMATVRSVAMLLGVQLPEGAVIALPANGDGEIGEGAADHLREAIADCDTLILGPGMSAGAGIGELVRRVLSDPRPGLSIVLDAGAVSCAGDLADVIGAHGGRVVMTPHHGEMARLTGLPKDRIGRSPHSIALDVARRFNAIVALKAAETAVAAPDGSVLTYASDCVGLATGGSGDVLAGVVGGLLARGASPMVATAWSVWLHGEAGRAAASRIGPIGFLARDLIEEVPRLMAQH